MASNCLVHGCYYNEPKAKASKRGVSNGEAGMSDVTLPGIPRSLADTFLLVLQSSLTYHMMSV